MPVFIPPTDGKIEITLKKLRRKMITMKKNLYLQK